MDQHFTSPHLADKVAEAAALNSPRRIGDFAAGEGELLAAALKKWPKAKIFGIDKDSNMIRFLKKRFVAGHWLAADFLEISQNEKSVRASFGSMDLILLNPPFSIRGSGLVDIKNRSICAKVSPALAFLLAAIPLLKRGGTVVAIIPSGLLHSDRDRMALNWIKRKYHFEIIDRDVNRAFKGLDVSCAIVKVIKRRSNSLSPIYATKESSLTVRRGSIDHVGGTAEAATGEHKFTVIHTTNMKLGRITEKFSDIFGSKPSASCPVVILPRVGRPNSGKVVAIRNSKSYLFTKCVIIIECTTFNEAKIIKKSLIENWDSVRACYGGTGACYTTIQSIKTLLGSLGF